MNLNGFIELSRLHISHWGHQWTNPRDRLYAMLGIASEDSGRAFSVDYRFGIYETYRSLFQFLAIERDNLDSLYASSIESLSSKRPS